MTQHIAPDFFGTGQRCCGAGRRLNELIFRACSAAMALVLSACASVPVATPAPTDLSVAASAMGASRAVHIPAVNGWSEVDDLSWPAAGQTLNRGFGEAARDAAWSLYANGGTELYCRMTLDPAAVGLRKTGARPLNLEHAVPADLIAEALGYRDRDCRISVAPGRDRNQVCKFAIADLHNLWPSYASVNSSRGKHRYIEFIEEEPNRRFTEFCPDYEYGKVGDEIFVEPDREARGDIARSLIYMHQVYRLPLDLAVDDKARLLEWNQADPPDAEEQAREREVRRPQGTWNPLVLPHG